jgi:hypothetical protein
VKAYRIDPWAKTIVEVENDGWRGAAMKRVLITPKGSVPTSMDSLKMFNGDRLWVDDKGYGTPGLRVFYVKGYDSPLCGMGLIVGLDEAGAQADPKFTLEQIVEMVIWCGLDTTGEVEPMREDTVMFKHVEVPRFTAGGPILAPGVD